VTECGETVNGREFQEYKEEFIGKLGYERKQEDYEGIFLMLAAAAVMIITLWKMRRYIQK
jgi:hypothetical protein